MLATESPQLLIETIFGAANRTNFEALAIEATTRGKDLADRYVGASILHCLTHCRLQSLLPSPEPAAASRTY